MVRLAYMLAKSAVLSTKTYRVPVFVRASELVGTSSDLFAVLSQLVIRNHGLRTPPFDLEDFEYGRIVLLVDGLDELAESVDRQAVVNFCLQYVAQYPKCSLALTTRPYSSVDRLLGVEKFKRYRISPLSMDDASRMLTNIGKGDAQAADWRHETLRKLEGVHGVELNPLLVTVFAVSSTIDKKDVPANITEIFAKFSELMLGRWDEKKGLSQQYQAKVKEALLSEYAFRLHSNGESSFMRTDFIDFASRRLREIHMSADLDTLVTEILDRSGLLRGGHEVEFRHHLLQEYFAAKGIPDIEFVRASIGDDWWRNSVVFYFGANPASVDSLLDVATSNRFAPQESFIAVGLALQACYLSNMGERMDVWKWVNGAASVSLATQLSDSDESSKDRYPISTFIAGYVEARDALALSGIEDPDYDISSWCSAESDSAMREYQCFWYAVGLAELGEFALLNRFIRTKAVTDTLLLTAIHFGCFFARELKSISTAQRKEIDSLVSLLNPIVAVHRHRITEEFRGQLLEYRRGGVVALDEVEPEEREA